MSRSRVLGFVMVIVGFLWLSLAAFAITGPVAREVAKEQMTRVAESAQTTFIEREVNQFIVEALRSHRELSPSIMLPGIVMFLGGVLIFFSTKPQPVSHENT